MNKGKKMLSTMMVCAVICSMFLNGCGKKDNEEAENNTSTSEVVETVKEKEYLSMQTSIAYSSGDTKNWTYGNQRKEFPDNESCYVRIGCTAITTGSFGKGRGDSIAVTYRFTGTENCKVEVSDGKATQVDTGDTNVTEFTHTVTAEKEKKAEEDIMIFRYSPNGAESVVLEVIYDDQVAEKYDEFNTIYFDEITNTQQ
jgi:hypothetical protein